MAELISTALHAEDPATSPYRLDRLTDAQFAQSVLNGGFRRRTRSVRLGVAREGVGVR